MEGVFDLTGVGEATGRLLGVDEVTVDGDLEDAVAALHELRGLSEALLDLVRQTGGAGFVVSNDTVFDADVGHGNGPLSVGVGTGGRGSPPAARE